MIAAQQFNTEKNNEIKTIYACITTGSLWKFIKLTEKNFYIDTSEYHSSDAGKIMASLPTVTLNLMALRRIRGSADQR